MANIRPLSSHLQKIATEELNEIENRIPEDLEHIKNWLKMQPHLTARSDDQWLVTFLRGCKYSLEKTKSKLDIYYSLRSAMPEYYKGRYPFTTALKDLLKMSSFAILPQLPPKPAVCLVRFDMCSLKTCTLTDAVKLWFMLFDVVLNEDDNLIVCGVETIFDLSQFTLNYAKQCTPTVMKKLVVAIEHAYPMRIKKIHVINLLPIFETIYSMIKLLVTKKLRNRMIIYGPDSTKEFLNQIPAHVLPKEYGGDNASIHELADDFNQKVENYATWFLDDEKYCSNESLRPSNTRSPDDVLGLEGSFRKLNVD